MTKYVKLFEMRFDPPGTPASLKTDDPVEALNFYKGQFQALSARMADIMQRQGWRRWPSTQNFTQELSDYADQYARAIRYTERFIRDQQGGLLESGGSRSAIELAKHPNTAAETLARLAQDPGWRVRAQVAQHPNAAVETLARLAQDKDSAVRWRVARNPNAAAETLARLAQDETPGVRIEVAKHPNTATETLADLSQDPDWRVRAQVAQHPNAAVETLARLAQDPVWRVRYEVVEHPNTGDEALYLLSKDEESEVREVALKALRPRQDQEMKSWGWDQEAIDLIRQLGV